MPASGTVTALRRYPVKSMLGEDLDTVTLTASGLDGDRVAAVIDQQTGDVATAKHPRLWRALLAFSAAWNGGSPRITPPGGPSLAIDDAAAEQVLSWALERDVRLTTTRPEKAMIGRPAPEDVIAEGDDADVPYEMMAIAQGTPGTNFVDYAPVHLVTSATLARVGVEMIRYRPNVVLDIPDATPFAENDWAGRRLAVGSVILHVMMPTARCAVPTLAHGALPRRTDAVRRLLQDNRIPMGSGMQPCLGAYARVVAGGTMSVGAPASLG